MAKRIEIQIIGDAASLSKAVKSGTSDLGRLDGAADKSSGKWDKFKGAAKAAAIGGIGAVTVALGKSVNAARDAEVTQTKMETQLKALGISYKAHAGEIDRVIAKTSKLAGLDDEDLQDAFTEIVRTTGDVTKSLELTGLAADFARAKHMDVAKAGELVAKVAGGNTGILSRYGVTVKKGASATEALGMMQQKFGGQAEAYGKTAAGAQDRFKVATENLQEALGKGLLPVMSALANAAANLIGWFEKHKVAAIALGAAVGVMLTAFAVGKVVAFTRALVSGAVPAFWALNAALTANPIGIVVVAIAALVAALVIAWKHSETFRNIVTGAFNVIKAVASAVMGAVSAVVTGHWNAIRAVTSAVWGAIAGTLRGAWGGIRSGASFAFNAVRGVVTGAWDAVRHATSTAWNAVTGRLEGAWRGIRSAASTAWSGVRSAIVNPFRDAVEWVVDKLGDLVGRVGRGMGRIRGAVADAGGAIFNALKAPFERALGAIAGIVDRIRDLVSSVGRIPGKILNKLGFAQGGTVGRAVGGGGGVIARVGELGPETLYLPPGAHVTQASQSAGRGGGDIVQHFHGPVGSPRQARIMANQLAYRLRFG